MALPNSDPFDVLPIDPDDVLLRRQSTGGQRHAPRRDEPDRGSADTLQGLEDLGFTVEWQVSDAGAPAQS